MPNCGVSQRENLHRCQVERRGSYLADQLQSPAIAPNCPFRKHLAEYAYNVAVRFVFDHELAHIWHGHVDQTTDRQGCKAIFEVSEQSSAGVSLLDSQTFELDADCAAVQMLVLRGRSLDLDHRCRDISLEKRFGENATSISIGLSTMSAFFSIMEQAIHVLSPLSKRHPPAHIRANSIKSTAAVVLRTRFAFYNKVAYEFCEQALVDGVLSFSRISQRPFDLAGYKAAQTKQYQEHNNRLLANYAKLKPALERAKRGGTLAEVKPQFFNIFIEAEAKFNRNEVKPVLVTPTANQQSHHKSKLSKRKRRRQID